jgi:hypothetical protein
MTYSDRAGFRVTPSVKKQVAFSVGPDEKAYPKAWAADGSKPGSAVLRELVGTAVLCRQRGRCPTAIRRE